MNRTAEISRRTSETDIRLRLALDGSGRGRRATGVGFFDHMLDALARHGGFDLDVEVSGDLETGSHHTVEDTGLVLGRALAQIIGDRRGLVRFGEATVPMDEARARAVVDLSGRPLAVWEGVLPPVAIAGFEPDLAPEFVRAVAGTARATVHVIVESGQSAHHMVEASFKAFGRALGAAAALSPGSSEIPSTKGVL